MDRTSAAEEDIPAAASKALDEVPGWVWTAVRSGRADGAVAACFASGVCELGAILGSLGTAAVAIAEVLTPILAAAGVVLVEESPAP